jgi:hypothetical protein
MMKIKYCCGGVVKERVTEIQFLNFKKLSSLAIDVRVSKTELRNSEKYII